MTSFRTNGQWCTISPLLNFNYSFMFDLIVWRQSLATFRFLMEYFKVNYLVGVERKLLLLAPRRNIGEWILDPYFHSLVISALDGNLQLDSLPQGKNSSAPIQYEAEWAPETERGLWRIGNLLWESNRDFSAVQQVA